MDYKDKIAHEVEHYREVKNIHDLPEVHHYWANKFLRPIFNEIMGVDSVPQLFANPFRESLSGRLALPRFLSIGSGDCSLEIGVADLLIKGGVTKFGFDCVELSPHLIGRAKDKIEERGLSKLFNLIPMDINKDFTAFLDVDNKYSGVMAHHSLHHFVALETIFDTVKKILLPGGVFVIHDMIGRNGHMRWPEAEEIISRMWRFLPGQYRYNPHSRIVTEVFLNHDCSVNGFEGIRAQDILPLLVERFKFKRFLAYGNLTDIFIDRLYGHNFDVANKEHTGFIDFMHYLNELLIDLGYLKPTMASAVMSLDGEEAKIYRNWTPEFCIRPR